MLSTSTTTDATATDTTAADTTAADTSTGGEGSSTGMMVECSDKPGKLAGPEVVIAAEFAELYTTYELGPVPGIPADARLGGCVISYDDPDTLLIAGYSEAPNGKIYKIGVERGNCDHIVGFTGQAAAVADTPYIDANLIYVKSGLLLYSEWPVNNISQLLPGANAPARTTGSSPATLTLPIEGMTCASCVRTVERNLKRVHGVLNATVNFATEKATVVYDPELVTPILLASAVRDAGYDVPVETATLSIQGMTCALSLIHI